MLEFILVYVCLLPDAVACKNTSQAYVMQNSEMFSRLEIQAMNALGPKIVAATPYLAFVVRKEATVVVTKNVSVKIKEEELSLEFSYYF